MALSLSPDGRLLASAGNDRSVRLWDLRTGREARTLLGHEGSVMTVSFSSDGARLASGSDDGSVRIWDSATGAEVARYDGLAVAFIPDGRNAVVAREDRVSVIDTSSGRVVRDLAGQALALSPDGRQLATMPNQDGSVAVWDVATGRVRRHIEGPHLGGAAGFTRDGRCFLDFNSTDNTIRLTELLTGRDRLHLVTEPPGYAADLDTSPDGRFAATACEDRAVRVWDLATGTLVRRFDGHTRGVQTVAFSADGRLLASAGADTTVLVGPPVASPRRARCSGRPPARPSWTAVTATWPTSTPPAPPAPSTRSSAPCAVAAVPGRPPARRRKRRRRRLPA